MRYRSLGLERVKVLGYCADGRDTFVILVVTQNVTQQVL
jgi:hypothetical protein